MAIRAIMEREQGLRCIHEKAAIGHPLSILLEDGHRSGYEWIVTTIGKNLSSDIVIGQIASIVLPCLFLGR